MSKSLKGLILGISALFCIVIIGGFAFVKRENESIRISHLESKVSSIEFEKNKAIAAQQSALSEANKQADEKAELLAKIEQIQAKAKQRLSLGASQPAPINSEKFGLGREALEAEIVAWDVDVLPDGRGLPVGSGDAIWGEEVFADKCASCHGDFAEGVDNWPVLAGGLDTLADKDPVKTVGSYWPHLSTVWDYVHRSMPFGDAQSLTDDETYAITAYILYSNDLVDDDFVLSNENFTEFEMYNKDGFVVDDREETEYALWKTEPCMQNCKPEAKITMRASVLNVTPDQETEMDTTHNANAETVVTQVAATETTEAKVVEFEVDPALAKAGEKVYKKCKACHQIGADAKNKTGPHLNDLIGRTIGSIDGFKYSKVFKQAQEDQRIWDAESLSAFLTKPKTYMKGTKMSFAGLKKEQEVESLLHFFISYTSDAGDDASVKEKIGFSVSPEILSIEGDLEYGEYLSSECKACHQTSGKDDGIPSIIGLDTEHFVTAMHAYRAKFRENQVMQLVAGRLADDEIAALAAYFKGLNN